MFGLEMCLASALKSWHYEAEFYFRNVTHCKLLFENKALWEQGKNLRIIKIIVVILNQCCICYPYYVKGHLNTSLIGPALDFRWLCFSNHQFVPETAKEVVYTYTRACVCTDGGAGEMVILKNSSILIISASPTAVVKSVWGTMSG